MKGETAFLIKFVFLHKAWEWDIASQPVKCRSCTSSVIYWDIEVHVEVDSRMQSSITTLLILLYGCNTASCENVWRLRMEKHISSFIYT